MDDSRTAATQRGGRRPGVDRRGVRGAAGLGVAVLTAWSLGACGTDDGPGVSTTDGSRAPVVTAAAASPTPPVTSPAPGPDGADPSPDPVAATDTATEAEALGCEAVPLVMPGGALVDATFVLSAGDMACADAREVVAEYLEQVALGASSGNRGYVELRGGSCTASGLVVEQEEGRLLSCEGTRWDTGGAADFALYEAGRAPKPAMGTEGGEAVDAVDGPVAGVLAQFGVVEDVPLCPAPEADYCLEVLSQTDDRAVVGLVFGLERDSLYLLDNGADGWVVVDEANLMAGELPDWAADALG